MKSFFKITFVSLLASIIISCNTKDSDSFAFGNFEAEELLVPAEVNGILKQMNVREGDHIAKGECIGIADTIQLHLKKLQLLAARSAVKARIEQVTAQVKVQEVSLANLQREHKRFSSLVQENAATTKQLDDIAGQMDVVRAQIRALKSQNLTIYAELDAQNAQILQVEDQIRRSLIMAPAEGQVLEVFVREGEMAMAGRPVIKMAELSDLILRVFIDGNQLSAIKLNDTVRVFYDGANEIQQKEGRVTWISPEAEFTPKIIQTRNERVNLVYAVKVLVPNDGSLKIGMPGEIQLVEQ